MSVIGFVYWLLEENVILHQSTESTLHPDGQMNRAVVWWVKVLLNPPYPPNPTRYLADCFNDTTKGTRSPPWGVWTKLLWLLCHHCVSSQWLNGSLMMGQSGGCGWTASHIDYKAEFTVDRAEDLFCSKCKGIIPALSPKSWNLLPCDHSWLYKCEKWFSLNCIIQYMGGAVQVTGHSKYEIGNMGQICKNNWMPLQFHFVVANTLVRVSFGWLLLANWSSNSIFASLV